MTNTVEPTKNQETTQCVPVFERLMYRVDQVVQLIPIGKSTIFRLVKEGKFPKPVKVGKSILWSKGRLEEFVKTLDEAVSKD